MFALLVYFLCMVVTLLVLAFLTFTAYLQYIHWKYSHIPQPKRASFYFGHLPDLSRDGNEELNFVTVYQQWSEEVKSPTFVVFFFYQPIIMTTDPENVKRIGMQPKLKRSKQFTNNFVSILGERFMKNGILTIEDHETWKPRRQLYEPAFKKSYLTTLLEPFNEMTTKLIEQLKPFADGVMKVPMKDHFNDFTLNVISKVGFGTVFAEEEAEYGEISEQRAGLKTLTTLSTKGLSAQLRIPGYKYLHPFQAAKYRSVVRQIRAIGRNCIKERIQVIENNEQTPNDILSHILQMASTKEEVDIEDLVDDFITFYFGGQESTQSLLTFALVLTLLHPDVLERLQLEVDEVLGDSNYVSADDLEKLEYTEQVLKETLRLHAPFSGSFPKEVAPGGTTLNGYHIPGGTQVMLSSALMCHLPENFEDPEVFNPGRFDRENKRPSSFVYFPFGLGQRSCIGKQFAMIETKILFARLLQTYKITLPDDYELVVVQRGVLQTKDDVECTLLHRQHR